MADILEFKSAPTLRTVCAFCGTDMIKRVMSNEPAYCRYEHAVAGQPDHRGASIGGPIEGS